MSLAQNMLEERFSEAGKFWHLESLYVDLASVKKEKLTPAEKEHLRGLLLGLGPKEIAQALYKGVGGVRVALCILYRYIEVLVELPEGKVNSRSAAHVLEKAGYRISEAVEPQPVLTESTQGKQPPLVTNSSNSCNVRILISHCNQPENFLLVQNLSDCLNAIGHVVSVLEDAESLYLKNGRPIGIQLAEWDCLLLLMSAQSSRSEWVTERVKRVRSMYDAQPEKKTVIIPVRVGFSLHESLNYDLRGFLRGFEQKTWCSVADTQNLLDEILELIAGQASPVMPPAVLPAQAPALEVLGSPPLNAAEPELPWGQVELVSAFYVNRPPIEARCFETIMKPGALIRIKGPRQMGKTSLLSRILYHAEKQDYLTLPLSFQLADEGIFTDLDRFLRWFCANVSLALQLPNRLFDYWDDIFGSKTNCKAYFEKYLLAKIDTPLALGLDEVDRLFQYPGIAEDFFGLLRAWHEEAKNREIWKKLRLIVVHSTEVYVPLKNNQSPFNVGLPIELPEFEPAQVLDLAQRHGLVWTATEVEQLMTLIGGHPYLVRVALYYVAKENLTLKELLQNAPTDSGPYSDHLRRHLWILEQNLDLTVAIVRMVAVNTPIRLETIQAFKLYSMGLVRLDGNDVALRCELYRQYFRDRLSLSEC